MDKKHTISITVPTIKTVVITWPDGSQSVIDKKEPDPKPGPLWPVEVHLPYDKAGDLLDLLQAHPSMKFIATRVRDGLWSAERQFKKEYPS